MAGLVLKFKINDVAALNKLKQLEDFNASSMFDEMGGYLDSSVALRFKNSIDPDGNHWAESERVKNEGGKTLVDFGHLRDSMTYQVFANGTGLEHGTNMVYAAIHQFGGTTGRNKSVELVERPFMGINAEDQIELNAIADDFLREALDS